MAPDPADWTAVPGTSAPIDVLQVDDVAAIGLVANATRARILRQLRWPKTVAEIAAELDAPKTRLYHHINLLTDAGLIQVVATRKVAAVTERRYQVVAESFALSRAAADAAESAEVAQAIATVFDVAKADFQAAVQAIEIESDNSTTLSLLHLRLSETARAELAAELQELVDRYRAMSDSSDSDGESTTVFVALFSEAEST